jgi:hypothetical protein
MGREARRRAVAFHGVDRQVDAFQLVQELLLS